MSVDTIRDIPVIVEHRSGGCNADFDPMDFDHYGDYDSGFPFDNTSRRTRDPLEDIAQRHPEFAQHLQGFPRRTQRTAGDQDEDEFLRRRFERPFSSGRFERFGFPFDRDDFEREPQRYYDAYPEHFENFQNQHPQSPSSHAQPQQQQQQYQQSASQTPPQGYQQYPPQYSQQYQPQPETQKPSQQQHSPQYQSQASNQSVSQGTQTECDSAEEPKAPQQSEQHQTDDGGVSQEQQQKVEGGQQTRGRPIQQSNTCDLAQHQPPDEALNERGQRSMSAPPENNNKRFTSSVNIPMGGHQENGAGGAKSQAGSGSTERVIPIHVEGRDDPVMPKRFSSGSSQTHHHQQQPQAERVYSESPRSQPETIFGRRPEAFTQFVNREPHRFPSNDWPSSFGSFPEDDFGFPRQTTESPSRFSGAPRQQQHQQPQRQETASQAHAQKPQEQKPSSSEPEATQQPPQPQQQQAPKQPQGPIEQIQAIQKDVSSLLRQVEAFSGAPKDKNYLWLDEMLTRNLLKLDNVETHGQDAIRSARKEAIKCIERTIGLLEAKAAANVAPKGDGVEQQPQENMDTESASGVSQDASAAVSRSASQKEVLPQESSDKIVEQQQQQQSKSGEAMENAEGEIIKDVNSEETQKVDEEVRAEGAAIEIGEAAVTAEVKEGEKKEKKKIKKKVNKEEKK